MKILITGASRGIGLALANFFAQTGHTVYKPTSKEFDFQNPEAPEACFQKYRDANVLINNAGICNHFDPATDSAAGFEKIFRVNFFAPVDLSLRFAAHWKQTGERGRIINMLSRVAKKGSVESPHYAASKAALLNFTHSMGAIYAPARILLFGISPSWVETDILTANAKDVDKARAQIPLQRFLTPQEICTYARFLVEDPCEYLTGQTIEVNGASYFP